MRKASHGRPRLAPITDTSRLTQEQRVLWDTVTGSARASTAIRQEGQLTGPFDVLLRSPEIGAAVSELGEKLRFATTLDPRLTEVVILAVAGHWRAGFSWLRHTMYADQAGVPSEAVAAIAARRDPEFEDARDAMAFAVAHSLVTTGEIADELYSRALGELGERALVEVVTLAGYYCLTSLVLNAFHVPLPPGATVPWRDGETP